MFNTAIGILGDSPDFVKTPLSTRQLHLNTAIGILGDSPDFVKTPLSTRQLHLSKRAIQRYYMYKEGQLSTRADRDTNNTSTTIVEKSHNIGSAIGILCAL